MPDPTHSESSSPESHRSLRSLPGHSTDEEQGRSEWDIPMTVRSDMLDALEEAIVRPFVLPQGGWWPEHKVALGVLTKLNHQGWHITELHRRIPERETTR